jgi:hypothetical protein
MRHPICLRVFTEPAKCTRRKNSPAPDRCPARLRSCTICIRCWRHVPCMDPARCTKLVPSDSWVHSAPKAVKVGQLEPSSDSLGFIVMHHDKVVLAKFWLCEIADRLENCGVVPEEVIRIGFRGLKPERASTVLVRQADDSSIRKTPPT